MPLHDALAKVTRGQDLSAEESAAAFDQIFSGTTPAATIAALLLGLHNKGETVAEILGAARSMRRHMLAIPSPPGTIDIVGTGGDNHGTLNVSTAAAFVVAACGVPVAKHGNRATTSRSGSSDVLRCLGLNLEADTATLTRCLNEIGLAFLFAPRHHPAMRHVAEVRRELKVRTIFNLLGPLTNPANVKRHLIGVYALEWLGPMAEVLKELGSDRAWLTHGHDGLDEISTTSPTDIVELQNSQIRHFTLTPEELGLPRATLDALKGGDADANADAIRRLFAGEPGPYRDIVVMNAAAALCISDNVVTLRDGKLKSEEALSSGAPQKKLLELKQMTK